MKLQSLADGISAAATAAQAAVTCNKTPFLAGRDVIANIAFGPGVTGSPVVKIQGSIDLAFTVPVDLLVSSGLASKRATITCMPYMRANMTTAGGAGLYSASIENAA
jgi:hypothetical protein